MAVNNVGWRSSLALNLRDTEYGEEEHELFHNLEKLIASAVSICRLDGSLQCQIGGLITVIEELQRLLRHSFTEILRLERTIDYQKQTFSTKVSDLHKQMKNMQATFSKWTQNDSHLSNDVDTAVTGNHIGQVSLVDASYGNGEESDSSIPYHVNGEPDTPEVIDGGDNTSYEEDSASVQINAEEINIVVEESNELEDIQTVSVKSDIGIPVTSSEKMTQTIPNVEDVPVSSKHEKTVETLPRMLQCLKEGMSPVVPRRQSRSLSLNPRLSNKINLGRRSIDVNSMGKSRQNHSNTRSAMKSKGRKDLRLSVQNQKGKMSPKTKGQSRKSMPSGLKTTHNQTAQKSVHLKNNGKNGGSKDEELSMDTVIGGNINLDFLLMVNQLMSDLVMDSCKEEATLDPVKESERNDVLKLAKLYRLRVRFIGKNEEELPVMLVKGRDSCLPKPGEVDVLLSSMSDKIDTKKQAGAGKKMARHKHKFEEGTDGQNPTKNSKKRKV